MFLFKNCVVDLPMSPEVQAEVIECFCEKDDLIIFGYIEYNEDDFKYMRKILQLKENDEIKFAESTLPKLRKPIFLSKREYKRVWGKSINTLKWYSVSTKEELITTIKEMGITYECYIVSKNSTSINNYKFKLYAYEHHIIDEKENTEHRSLFINGVDLDSRKITFLPKLEKVLDKYNE